MQETIFTKIIKDKNKGKISADIVYEDEICIAIKDIHPQAPVHVLLIPKKVIPQLSLQEKEDREIISHLMTIAPQVAAKQGIAGKYRLVINDGAEAGQSVFHLHLHILGGRPLHWPPG